MLAGIEFLNSHTLLCLIVAGSSKVMGSGKLLLYI